MIFLLNAVFGKKHNTKKQILYLVLNNSFPIKQKKRSNSMYSIVIISNFKTSHRHIEQQWNVVQ